MEIAVITVLVATNLFFLFREYKDRKRITKFHRIWLDLTKERVK